jgi:hypothetical protein
LRAAGDDDVQAGRPAGFKERSGALMEGAQGDEFVETHRGQEEAANIDCPMTACGVCTLSHSCIGWARMPALFAGYVLEAWDVW